MGHDRSVSCLAGTVPPDRVMTPAQSCQLAPFYRPTRGAIRLNALYIDPEPLRADLRHIVQTVEWKVLKYGEHWAQIVLLRDEFRHPLLTTCPALERAIAGLPSRAVDACLKLLGPGGFVHEHRDMTGAVPMGVVRLHVPIVTHTDAEFYVTESDCSWGPERRGSWTRPTDIESPTTRPSSAFTSLSTWSSIGRCEHCCRSATCTIACTICSFGFSVLSRGWCIWRNHSFSSDSFAGLSGCESRESRRSDDSS